MPSSRQPVKAHVLLAEAVGELLSASGCCWRLALEPLDLETDPRLLDAAFRLFVEWMGRAAQGELELNLHAGAWPRRPGLWCRCRLGAATASLESVEWRQVEASFDALDVQLLRSTRHDRMEVCIDLSVLMSRQDSQCVERSAPWPASRVWDRNAGTALVIVRCHDTTREVSWALEAAGVEVWLPSDPDHVRRRSSGQVPDLIVHDAPGVALTVQQLQAVLGDVESCTAPVAIVDQGPDCTFFGAHGQLSVSVWREAIDSVLKDVIGLELLRRARHDSTVGDET